MSERTLQALRGRINARLQTSAISRDRASAAGREVVAQCRQSDVETLEWVLSEIDAALATAEPSGEAGGDSTDCPTCGDELAVYWEEGRIRGVVSLDQPARAALLRTPRGEGEAVRLLGLAMERAELLCRDAGRAEWPLSDFGRDMLQARLDTVRDLIGDALAALRSEAQGEVWREVDDLLARLERFEYDAAGESEAYWTVVAMRDRIGPLVRRATLEAQGEDEDPLVKEAAALIDEAVSEIAGDCQCYEEDGEVVVCWTCRAMNWSDRAGY